MRQILCLGAALVSLSGCVVIVAPDRDELHIETPWSSNSVEGNGQQASAERSVTALPRLEVSGSLQVDVRVGPVPSLRIEGDSNLLPLVRTEVAGSGAGADTLKIWLEQRVHSSAPLRVIYTVPQPRTLHASGSGQLNVSGLDGAALELVASGSRMVQLAGRVGRLDIRASGSGNVNATALAAGSTNLVVSGSARVNLGKVQGEEFNAKLSGSSLVSAGGSVRSANVKSDGRGTADLVSLSSLDADLSSSGSGDISVSVANSVVAQTSGSGHIAVYGEPVQRNTVGRNITIARKL